MRILVLGGTSFVGRAIVEDARRTGADVTLFGRGRTGAGLFPSLVRLIGDRDTGDYAALRDGRWDAVVDVSGYVPRHVGQAMDALGDRAGRYLFISSHAVYQRAGLKPGATEDTPRRPPVRDTEELSGETYGPLKVACEDDVVARYGAAGDDRAAGQGGRAARLAGLGSHTGCGALPGAAGWQCPATRSSRFRSLTRETWRAWWCRNCLPTTVPAHSTRSAPPTPVTLGELVQTCARVAHAKVEIVPVPLQSGAAVLPAAQDELAIAAAQPGACQSGRHARYSAGRHGGRCAGLGPPARRATADRWLHP